MVERFAAFDNIDDWGMRKSEEGEYVLYSDYEAELSALKKEASKFAEWVQDYSNDGHIARAARSFLDKWEGRDG